jgi:hypothetical protein
MDRIISLVLKEFSDENINIDVYEKSVKITTSSNSITINNRSREAKNGMYRSPRNQSYTPYKVEPPYKIYNQEPQETQDNLSTIKLPTSLQMNEDNNQVVIKEKLNVTEFDAPKYLYRESKHNFIVKQRSPGLVEVIGKLHDNGDIIPLTSKELEIAHDMGLHSSNDLSQFQHVSN